MATVRRLGPWSNGSQGCPAIDRSWPQGPNRNGKAQAPSRKGKRKARGQVEPLGLAAWIVLHQKSGRIVRSAANRRP